MITITLENGQELQVHKKCLEMLVLPEDLDEVLSRPANSIGFSWCTDDVLTFRPDLTQAQCMEVLKEVEAYADCVLGITWATLEFHAEELFPKNKRQEQ